MLWNRIAGWVQAAVAAGFAVALGVASASPYAPGAEPRARGERPAVGSAEDPVRLLRAAAEAVSRAPFILLDIRTSVSDSGYDTPSGTPGRQTQALFQRPDRFLVRRQEPDGVQLLQSDGVTVMTYFSATNSYFTGPAGGLPKRAWLTRMAVECGDLAAAMAGPDPLRDVVPIAPEYKYDGPDMVDGQSVVRLKRDAEARTEYVMLTTGEPPLLVGTQSVLRATTGEVLVTYRSTLKWTAPTDVTKQTFAIRVPEGARKVTDPSDTVPGERIEPPRAVAAATPKPTPVPTPARAVPGAVDGSFSLRDGRSLPLASLRGRRVVVLDFFATWCGPCKQSLPKIAEIAQEYRGRGVDFYAVNLQESSAKADSVVQQLGGLPGMEVVYDMQGSVYNTLGGRGIPLLVVLDRDGRVIARYTGAGPATYAGLRRDLEQALR